MVSFASKLTVDRDDADTRLDIFLSNTTGHSRSQIQKLIKEGRVKRNGVEVVKTGEQVHAGDTVEVLEAGGVLEGVVREMIPIDDDAIVVIADTSDYVVINKPSGVMAHPVKVVVHQEELAQSGTVAGWLMRQYPAIWGVGEYANRPGIVHRLDKEASGLMVAAKNKRTFEHLKKQFQDRTIEKHYWALAYGAIDPDHHVIQFPIDRSKEGRMVARPHIEKITLKNVKDVQEGRDAMTEFWVEKRFHNYTLVNVRLHTGRTHQIRVHFFAYNHPLVGDPLYFHKKRQTKHGMSLPRLFLHAYQLCFDDVQKERHCFESKLPEELKSFLSTLH